MVGFRIDSFIGAQPSKDPRQLPESVAQAAVNMRVESGALDPLCVPALVKALKASTRFVYRIPGSDRLAFPGSNWIEFDDPDTDMVRTPVVNDSYKRYYWASPSTGFRYATEANLISGGAASGLVGGIERPGGTPLLDVIPRNAQVDGELKITRSYIVSFVSDYGEESPPCLPVEAEGYAGDIWRLRSLPQPVIMAGYTNVKFIRIYRTETAASGATVFNRVVDVNVGQTIYEDTLSSTIVNGQPILESNDNDMPPDMDGLALMPNGVLVGFKGNNLYFSKNYEPHAWPAAYTLAVQHPIVGLAVYGTTCVVCTQGNPVAVTGTSGDVMTLTASDTAMPCISRRGIAVAAEGVYYPTTTGLVLYTSSGPTIVSDDLIGRKLWEQLYNPRTIDGVVFAGGYVGLRGVAEGFRAFQFIAGSVVEIDVQTGFASYPYIGTDVWSNKPWLILGGNLYEWIPASGANRSARWMSKEFRVPKPVSMGAVQVYADGPVRLRVYSFGRTLMDADVQSGVIYRLPGGFKADVWAIELVANVRVHNVFVAQTVSDLKRQ